MTTKLPPNVPTRVVELDRPRTIALTLAALKRIKDLTGSFDMGLSEDAIFDRAPSLVWAALVDEDREDLTPEDLSNLLHAGNLGQVVRALGDLAAADRAEGNAKGSPAPKAKAKKASR